MSVFALPFPQIDPVAIALGPISIRWYALAYLVGLLAGWWLVRRLIARPGWTLQKDEVDDLLFYVTLGVILGGRLGYVSFYNPVYFLGHPLEIFAVWSGGMSFHGGLIGVIVAVLAFAVRRHRNPFEIGDILCTVAPIGLFFGRIANFINGELWGRVTDVPWGVVFPAGGTLPRHPSQLYEAFLEGLILFAIVLYLALRRRRPGGDGLVTGAFFIGYGVARFIVEFVREPDAQLGFILGPLTMGQLLSLPMIGIGLCFVLYALRNERRTAPA